MALLRRVKDKIKKIVARGTRKHKTPASAAGKARVAKAARPGHAQEAKKETIGIRETVIEKTKFSHPEAERSRRIMVEELPGSYGKDRIVLQVRDPWWLHSYWEITAGTLEGIKGRLGDRFWGAKKIVRVYDVSNINFDGNNAHRFFDVDVGDATNWYIDAGGPGRSWCADIGLLLGNGEFITIARSNTVSTPLDGPSWITDEEWMIPEEMFARLYGMGFGFGRSSPVGKAWQERMKRELFSGVLASPGITSVSSPAKALPRARKFWLVVNTELIVYGATEPDAKVTVQGKEITLRPDGTFSLRFALPDGKQVIPVHATSNDGIDERTITPIVTKETR
ncbi:MAG: DUF4912 domain-containing protein [Candidatus Omnitrophica bacterium]|nr:DUF4912 domain-containing protein [Candidatus Omnitrophota bacterium]